MKREGFRQVAPAPAFIDCRDPRGRFLGLGPDTRHSTSGRGMYFYDAEPRRTMPAAGRCRAAQPGVGTRGRGSGSLGGYSLFHVATSSITSTQHNPDQRRCRYEIVNPASLAILRSSIDLVTNDLATISVSVQHRQTNAPRSPDGTPSVANANQKFPSIRHRPRPWQSGPSTWTYSISPYPSASYQYE